MEEEKLLKKRARAAQVGNRELQANMCRKLGDLYVSEERFEEALNMFKEVLNISAELGQVIEVAVANRLIGEVFSNIGEYLEALKYQKRHLELAKQENDLIEEQRALATIGRTYFCMAESMSNTDDAQQRNRALREAKQAYNLSLRVCDKLHNIGRVEQMQMRNRLLLNIGLVLECQGDFERAAENIKSAINISVKEDLYEDTYRCYAALGMMYHRQGDSAKALRYLDLAMETAERLPDKTSLLCETLLNKSEVYFSQANFQGAKSVLFQARKLNPTSRTDMELLTKNLKIALVLCQTEEALVKTNDNDYAALKQLNEKMGDGCCAVNNYKSALTYYHRMLECAEAMGEGGTELVPIYVSLSQTYKDNGDYLKALEYSYKELELWENNPAEACKTTINIAVILEMKGASYNEIVKTYNDAYALAAKAESESLEIRVLRHLLDFQNNNGTTEEIEETKKRLDVVEMNVMNPENLENEEEEEAETQDFGSNVCLEDYLEDEEDENEEYDRPHHTRKQTQGLKIKRNEKGESQLHVACINGNLARVRKLLELGHPVNIQDNGGWVPLQEAANHGFVEIVEELLDHGADINSPGGKGAGGVTALHDAASNGHLRVMELLLDRGALIDVRTDNNETPLDCLMDWKRRLGKEPPDDPGLFESIKARLETALQKAGVATKHTTNDLELPGSSSGKRPRSVHKGKVVDLRRGLEDSGVGHKRWRTASSSSDESDDSIVVKNRRSRTLSPAERSPSPSGSYSALVLDHDESGDGAQEYQRVIKGLRERLPPEPTTSKICEKAVRTGNILVEDDIGDDWLEDDLGDMSRPSKRRKTKVSANVNPSEYIGTSRRQSGLRNLENEVGTSRRESGLHDLENAVGTSRRESGLSDMENNVGTSRRDSGLRGMENEGEDAIDEHFNIEDIFSQPFDYNEITNTSGRPAVAVQNSPRPEQQQVSLLNAGFTRSVTSAPGRSVVVEMTNPTLRAAVHPVKIRVEGKLLLVPISSVEFAEQKVGWLAKQASERYYKLEGAEPTLTLLTKDGASLCPDDPISIITDNDELLSYVTSWTLSPLTKRYEDACKAMDTVLDIHIQRCLEECDSSRALVLTELGLAASQLKPVFHILRPQGDLQQLLLDGNMLMDDGIKCLTDCLCRLHSLEVLNLSCNGITSVGLDLLRDVVSQSSSALPILSVLNLSYNDFDDDWLICLHEILKALPTLRILSVQSCSLTGAAFDSWKKNEQPLSHVSNLVELNISDNPLGSEGVEGFLRFLDASQMVDLNVAGTGDHSVATQLAQFLQTAVPRNLTRLDVSNCNITDPALSELIGSLHAATKLQSLHLRNNRHLSSASLLCFSQLPSPPCTIDLAGCHNILEHLGSSSPTQWLQGEFLKKLQALTISKKVGNTQTSEWEHVEQLWRHAWGPQAMVQKGPIGLLRLSVVNL
ncbi:tonsoku-like protein [Anabrus simplex]|uniref:tonsoku-like protein n=1 Tax=Anabrus simplex TaxID=316456 RepID=UPI0035A32BC1